MNPIRLSDVIRLEWRCAWDKIEETGILTDRELINKMAIKDGMKVLDVGSGTGRDVKSLLKKYPNCKVSVLDNKQGLLDRVEGATTKVLSDAIQLPFPDNYFDVAYANSVFCEMKQEDVDLALKEMQRVAKKVYYTEVYEDFSVKMFEL